MQKFFKCKTYSGFILTLVVVFSAVFMTIGLGLAGYLLEMQKAESYRIQNEKAFDIAEAGLNYYAWHLAHFSSDLQDGTGAAGPYVHTYQDPEGGTAGTYSLSINGNLQCNQQTAIDITSTGSSAENPARSQTVFGRYAKESVASYSYVLSSAVWAGATRTIKGRYHSNNGIRMDGANLSTVESSVNSWSCTSSYGCSPTATKNGVFGTGAGSSLWTYPVPQIDFASISVNLATIKAAAQSAGLYFAPATGSQAQRGYHLIFNGDGTVTVKRVTATMAVWGNPDGGSSSWEQEHNIISSETLVGTYTIPSDCGAIFVEDRVWVEGTVKGKITLAATDLISGTNRDVYIPNNINYTAADGSDGLTVVASGNVLLTLNSPDVMTLHGIFIAQNGYYGRNYYCRNGSCPHDVPSAYQSGILQTSLTTVGTIVSNGRTGTAWLDGSGTITSGYQTRVDSYDGNLATNPPPFTPYTSSQYEFVQWREQ